MKKQLYVSFLCLSVGLLLVGCSSQPAIEETVATSSINESTSGWQTYTHEETGFTVQYPPDWEVETFAGSPNYVMIHSPDREPGYSEGPAAARMLIWMNSDPLQNVEDMKYQKKIMIAGKQVDDTGWETTEPNDVYAGGDRSRYIKFNNPLVTIALVGGLPNVDPMRDNEKIMEDILTTVKFAE